MESSQFCAMRTVAIYACASYYIYIIIYILYECIENIWKYDCIIEYAIFGALFDFLQDISAA